MEEFLEASDMNGTKMALKEIPGEHQLLKWNLDKLFG